MLQIANPYITVFVKISISMYRYIYHESFEAEKFCGFRGFLHIRETFLYESSRWCCSNMDLRESGKTQK